MWSRSSPPGRPPAAMKLLSRDGPSIEADKTEGRHFTLPTGAIVWTEATGCGPSVAALIPADRQREALLPDGPASAAASAEADTESAPAASHTRI
eukprot:scaffold136597_cov31-Tisochrysis_lutea.AAC.2